MHIKLIVLRTGNPKVLADFYSLLGFVFDYHQHGNGPFHYAAPVGAAILEIYPLTKSQTEADKHLRLGFSIDDFDSKMEALNNLNIPFLMQPTATAFGMMAIVSDPDNRKVELYKS
ncbi:VOC family protein [Polluticaenibacter yanchengensis]|uniref:Glyoxalase/bleomycin resistance/extradiol dioxygenase family protein n=1 Tax=Polluticaenibacter yanchengensis TaxID=3014562 RepID=A0ABT4ULP4_9BACT|nr:glyoxalase/bleomycin resistance/extradiol dioxygenase family protein [Chitinophagaceae bacterium LY-5]